ncbi:MAG: hypothetical protein QM765_43005 [Myxococcales bacterium]
MVTRTATLRPKSMKLQWVMSSQRIPRELPQSDTDTVDWQLQLENSEVLVRVTFSAQDYRRLLRELEAHTEAMVTLDGFLVGAKDGFALEKVRFKVDRRRGGPPKA